MFSALTTNPGKDEYIKTWRHQWVYSKMTNMKDASNSNMYFSLESVEYQEFVCRTILQWYEDQRAVSEGFEYPEAPEDRIYAVFEKLWEAKEKRIEIKKKQDAQLGLKNKKKVKKWPQLVPLPEDTSDDDD